MSLFGGGQGLENGLAEVGCLRFHFDGQDFAGVLGGVGVLEPLFVELLSEFCEPGWIQGLQRLIQYDQRWVSKESMGLLA